MINMSNSETTIEVIDQNKANHYDEAARNINHKYYDWRSGSESFPLDIRDPYLFLEAAVREHLGEDPSKKSVLDYACGHGLHSTFPAKLGAKVMGIDISKESLKIAIERAQREGVADKCTFLEMDCENLTFADNSFDIVYESGSLYYMNLEKALSEIARVLKPDGVAILIESLGDNPVLNFNRWLKHKRGLRDAQTVGKLYTMDNLEVVSRYFEKVEKHFFNLSTFFAVPSRKLPGYKTLVRILEGIDGFLFKYKVFQRLAFKELIVVSRPKKLR